MKYLLDAWVKHSEIHPSDKLLIVGSGNQLGELRSKYGIIQSVVLLGELNILKFLSSMP